MLHNKPGPTTLHITDTNDTFARSHIGHNKRGFSHKKLTEIVYLGEIRDDSVPLWDFTQFTTLTGETYAFCLVTQL